MVAVACRCGQVTGETTGVTARTVNRVVCYCADCQAFAHHLGRADLLDAHGGSDIVQMAPAMLRFSGGLDRIAGVRLTPKGLYRWYATCCATPLGNTVGPKLPFVGIEVHTFAFGDATADAVVGPVAGRVHGEAATGRTPAGSQGVAVRLLARISRLVVGWRLSGKAWPNPFFDRATRQPLYPVTVLSPEQREALRALCGPGAAQRASSQT